MNSSLRRTVALAGLLLVFVAACTPERDPATLYAPEAVGVLVIDGVLIVGEPLPVIRLTRTLAPDVPYSLAAAREEQAEVIVTGPTGAIRYEEIVETERTLDKPGYRPAVAVPPLVEPEATYTVSVTTTQGEVLTAATLTPARFAINKWVLLAGDGATTIRQLRTFAELGDSVFTHPDNQLAYAEGLVDGLFDGTAAAYGAAGFQAAVFSLDPEAGFVIDPPFLDDGDFADLPRLGSSPIFNGEDGSVRLPWFAIFYDGRYLYKAFAVDRNWFDLERTIPQGGGSFIFGGNVGEGVDPPLFHVVGGIGLFGSASVDSVGFSILPRDSSPQSAENQ